MSLAGKLLSICMWVASLSCIVEKSTAGCCPAIAYLSLSPLAGTACSLSPEQVFTQAWVKAVHDSVSDMLMSYLLISSWGFGRCS